ncbi:ATP-dependent RNA helicase SUPV3L1/SUV3 [Noviherbaspirillum humi]|uniref:ATP-dependent RNA helicase SUPV3L1/SUV3 n=1 Tax=Noviherbaspirillum humi TaxID=1688639 RepID=A0A239G8A5_9BURK|nr:helicase-related protein [Noviherbaspirillum humi]SNS65397.1 ATP-dependent RNA helicase SUPV3L1/SUV3 [Noviherbaspirillum humi]
MQNEVDQLNGDIDPGETAADDAPSEVDGLAAERHVEQQGADLVKQDGRVLVRFAGEVVIGPEKLRVPYDLVPPTGVLAKAGKWRNMKPEARLQLVQERVNAKVASALHAKVQDFAMLIAEQAADYGLDPMPFLRSLAVKEVSEPVDHVMGRIEQRLEHAVERQQEEDRALRTRQSINLAEYPESFEMARRLPRKFIALLGPTNSGKTHQAMEALAKARSGVYLAPLRLLALENYERLLEARPHGEPLKVNLVTGEERRMVEGATHVASTVEMLDTKTRVDVAVIDEIQMLADRDRGAAWTAAVCGAPATTVYLVGALEARRAIHALAERMEIPLEVHVLKRKGPLSMEHGPVRKLRNLRRGDAVIAFSRREVLMWRDLITEAGFSVSTVYGNLSPEVRRAQAARFREGEADIVVGTDAIAMGLNLPIERVVMTSVSKFNGVEEEELSAALARQIAGRAGRYGVHEEGFVAGYDEETHYVMRSLLQERPAPVPLVGFAVAPTLEHLNRIASVTGEQSLSKLLKRFAFNIDVPDGFFTPRITEEQAERALWLDTLPLSVADKFTLSLVPVSSRVPSLHQAWQQWARALARKHPYLLQRHAELQNWNHNLQEVEDSCRLFSAYAWLGYRIPAYFPDIELAQRLAREASERVDGILQSQNATMRKKRKRF